MTITTSPTEPGSDSSGSAISPALANSYQRQNQMGSGWIMMFLFGAMAIGMIGFVALILGTVALSDGSSGPVSTTADIGLAEYAITGDLTVPAGEVTLRVGNNGSLDHNIGIRELGVVSNNVGPGGTIDVSLGTLNAGTYQMFCDIAGHEAAGMVGTLTVVGDGEAAPADAGGGHGGHGEMDFAAMDIAMTESMLAFPAETEGKGNPILEPTEILADGTKVFDLTAEIVDWEVEPGKFVEAWTYNGVVPAPQFVLDRNDRIQVRVVNNLPMGTDIHWHGVHTPNDQDGVAPYTQDLIEPNGGTFTYEFVVDEDAIGMYHAHNHAQMQVVNGMFGVFRVGDNPVPYGQTFSGVTIPTDLELAVDMPMILNDAGTIGLSLNGKSFPATEALVLDQGDWASITYYNEGLQIHPMHLHQFPQLVYAKDGIPLQEPYWVDTLNVAPGERYTVLFQAGDPGTWVWHCHILTHVERSDGMFGMVTAIVVDSNPDFDPTLNPVEPSNWRNTAGAPIDRTILDDMDGEDHSNDDPINNTATVGDGDESDADAGADGGT